MQTTPEEFDPSKLSTRESEILDLAVEGLTDQQIARKLEISVSTVNSYWVRIRGKVGFFSRTELATKSLRAKAKVELQSLRDEIEGYRRLAEQREHDGEAVRGAEIYIAALEAMPEPIVVTDEAGRMIFVNTLLLDLFGYEQRDLIAQPIETLLLPSLRADHRERMAELLHQSEPMRLGIDRVVYGRHKSGARFRVMLLLRSTKTANGRVATCIVRNFLTEVDTLRRRASAMTLS